MRLRDVLASGSIGLRTRRLRAALSVLGISIGIASIVAVLGISGSTQANLLGEIDALGTNLLTAAPGQAVLGGAAQLYPGAVSKIVHIPGVQSAAGVYQVPNAAPLRTSYINPL